jgi:hypothetical protein
MRTQISVEDHVVLQLLSSAIEASELSRRAPALARSNKRIMTFGLLWGMRRRLVWSPLSIPRP